MWKGDVVGGERRMSKHKAKPLWPPNGCIDDDKQQGRQSKGMDACVWHHSTQAGTFKETRQDKTKEEAS
jgi:hypothetical protein